MKQRVKVVESQKDYAKEEGEIVGREGDTILVILDNFKRFNELEFHPRELILIDEIKMHIYTITHEHDSYDCYLGHTIVAKNEEDVRQLAKNKSADEGKEIWDNAKVEVHGDYKAHATEPFILMSDFKAG